NPNNIIANNNNVLGAVTINGVTIENGLASDAATPDGPNASGGGIRDQGPVDLTLNNDILANNSATADGGGVAMENVVSTRWALVLNNTTVINNHAGDAGGGIDEDGTGLVNINNSTIADNTTLNQGAGVWLDAINGGTAALNVTNSIVRGNTAGALAGGLGQAGSSTVTISNSTIEDNATTGFGGGFADENNLGTLIVQNSLFQGNKAGTNGGGIQEGGPHTTISNSEFKGNAAGVNGAMPIGTTGNGKPNGVEGSGGGLFIDGGILTLTASTIADNTATINGGGIELQTTGSSTITNSTLAGNTALNSGGTGNGGGIDDGATGPVALVDDTITNNFAVFGGGFFYLPASPASSITFQNTIVAQNFVTAAGQDVSFNVAPTNTVDLGGNFIGIGNPAFFTAATTQQGTVAKPLNPMVAGLTNNGGPLAGATGAQMTVETEALLPGSLALGKGVANAIVTDERGAPRVNKFDVGAFQFETATLQLTIGTQTTLGLGATETVTVTVTNTSGNPLPSDGSTLMVTASGGLNIGGPLTFAVGPLAAGQSQTFSFNATGVTLGGQTITATVISPDTNPNATAASTTVNVVAHTTPTPAPTPSAFQAALALFVDAVELVLSQHGFPGLPSPSALFASIQTNLPFAGGLGIQALIAGVNAANNALGNT
ncbi:MAG TPA: choice-of-anchor Q domain-containing protein, partial [Gemmataceae bacterium]